MYNKGKVLIGLAILVVLVTFPIWFNVLTGGKAYYPEVVIPESAGTECVLPAVEMRDKHMQILDEWRDDVLREGNRDTVTVNGKEYRKGLQMACMQCHYNKEEFCDTCHDYTSVSPYCWECHLTPEEQVSKKEVK